MDKIEKIKILSIILDTFAKSRYFPKTSSRFILDLRKLIITIGGDYLFSDPVIMNHQVLTVEGSTKSKTPTNFQTLISSERVVIPSEYFEELEITRNKVRT